MSLGQEAKNDENTSIFERLHKDFVSAMKTNYAYLKKKLKRFFFVQVFLNKSHCRKNFGKKPHISSLLTIFLHVAQACHEKSIPIHK